MEMELLGYSELRISRTKTTQRKMREDFSRISDRSDSACFDLPGVLT
jgi:hypothetical protein